MAEATVSPEQAATQLLDVLTQGSEVTLDITARDVSTGGLVRLISAVHDAARARQVGVTIEPTGSHSIRLQLADPGT